jgi:hypothetical protein
MALYWRIKGVENSSMGVFNVVTIITSLANLRYRYRVGSEL